MRLSITGMPRKLILTLFVAAITAVGAMAARTWEEVEQYPVPAAQEQPADDVLVTCRDGYVYVAVSQTMQVKLFTLLGHVIVQDTLQPGVYRYKLMSRGIYLLKAGSTTRRITI